MKSIWINSFIGMIILATSSYTTTALAARSGSRAVFECRNGEEELFRRTKLGELKRINSCVVYSSGGETRIVLLGVVETSENMELMLIVGRNSIDRSGNVVLFNYTFETDLNADDTPLNAVPRYQLNFKPTGRNGQELDLSRFIFIVDPGAKTMMYEKYVLGSILDEHRRDRIAAYVLDRSSN